jgi:hypothetical protein
VVAGNGAPLIEVGDILSRRLLAPHRTAEVRGGDRRGHDVRCSGRRAADGEASGGSPPSSPPAGQRRAPAAGYGGRRAVGRQFRKRRARHSFARDAVNRQREFRTKDEPAIGRAGLPTGGDVNSTSCPLGGAVAKLPSPSRGVVGSSQPASAAGSKQRGFETSAEAVTSAPAFSSNSTMPSSPPATAMSRGIGWPRPHLRLTIRLRPQLQRGEAGAPRSWLPRYRHHRCDAERRPPVLSEPVPDFDSDQRTGAWIGAASSHLRSRDRPSMNSRAPSQRWLPPRPSAQRR